MADTHPASENRSPWRSAFTEARAVALAAVLIAVAFNLLSATRINWVYEPRTSGSSVDSALARLNEGSDTAQVPLTATPVDTAAVPADPDTTAIPNADSAVQAKRTIDSLARLKTDSIRTAQMQAKRAADSAAAATSPRNDKQALIDQAAGMKEIQTPLAKDLFDRKAALFIDARPEDHFQESHIPGAINCYAEQWQAHLRELIQIPKETMIITYCGGGDECELSHDLADHLRELGFKRVTVYKGGIKDWTAKGYPLGGTKK